MPSPEQRFADVVDEMLGYPDVTPPSDSGREFGSNALKVSNRIFAMLVRGNLVVKLPARRVTELIKNGEGAPFDAGKGKPMKEWLTIPPSSRLDWNTMSKEALDFVSVRGQ